MKTRFLIALQFLTILPVSIKGKIEDGDFGRSLVYFPVIGLLLGTLLAGIAFISTSFPPLVGSALILIVWVVITGAIHLDGFADTCDGFYGKRSKEDILKIMRDSRIGTMGAAGIALLLLFKFAIIASIHPEDLWKILLAAAVSARWLQAFACSVSKYARDEGKAKYFVKYAKRADIFAGAVFTLILNWFLMGIKGIVLTALLSVTIFLFIQYAKRKIGGMTGDTIGAANEIAEVSALLFCLILVNCNI
ncbi:MAG: adenosylcobinamide-GDP ribazoletransferase [Candidatus Omnitrophota bacterium]|nr:adenosylcobinamide-GDP ribazoletransferase [Candidatus Omnitrophota bacterium]